jgi:5'-nucleotidase
LVETPDVVLSGINSGGNMGADVYHSGTVAAAREAVLSGIKGVALSYYRAAGHDFDWDLAAKRAARALRAIWNAPSESGVVWNINLPSVPSGAPEPEIVFCQHNTSPLPVSFQRDETGAFVYSGHYHTRCRPAEGDVSACFGGAIAISKIPL